MKKILLCTVALAMAVMLAACGDTNVRVSDSSVPGASQAQSNVQSLPSGKYEATLFIGTQGNFVEYTAEYDTEPTPDMLIESIAEKTGWNLTLEEPVSVGKSYSVVFSKESALYVGPPDPQNEEFFVYDSTQLCDTILDSTLQTLQYNAFVHDGTTSVDTTALDIYFLAPDGNALDLPDAGITLSLNEPYKGSSATQS